MQARTFGVVQDPKALEGDEHADIKPTIGDMSRSQIRGRISFRKWIPPGRDNKWSTTIFIP